MNSVFRSTNGRDSPFSVSCPEIHCCSQPLDTLYLFFLPHMPEFDEMLRQNRGDSAPRLLRSGSALDSLPRKVAANTESLSQRIPGVGVNLCRLRGGKTNTQTHTQR